MSVIPESILLVLGALFCVVLCGLVLIAGGGVIFVMQRRKALAIVQTPAAETPSMAPPEPEPPRYADAQYDLGMRHERGEDGEPDLAEASVWYHKAADQGHAMAQYSLGKMYQDGDGVARDPAAALG